MKSWQLAMLLILLILATFLLTIPRAWESTTPLWPQGEMERREGR